MKFRFCGDLDCPDWVLAEITTLSKMTSVKMKLFCIQIMKYLLTGEIDYEKTSKLTTDAKYDVSDFKAAIAATDFIFTSAAKYYVDSDTLSNELQQLGLPKELTTSLCKVYGDKLEALRDILKDKSMQLSSLQKVEWRIDHVLGSSFLENQSEPEIQLALTKSNEDNSTEEISFTMTDNKFRVLLAEMREVRKQMQELM